MKFVSWNVNGIRAAVQKGFEEFFKETDADVFCIQESKMQEGQLTLDLPGYYQYWNYAEKKGYSGTAVFTKQEPLSAAYGIGIEEHDKEGRVITLEFEEYYLITVYTPNSQDGLKRLDYRMQWETDFLAYLKKLEEHKPVIFCGDLNVAHREIDLKNPKSNRKNAGFTDEERQKFTKLVESGFIDTFRYFYPEVEDVYSWWSYRFNARSRNAGWRIDYFCVSAELKERLADAKILTDVMGSDHCPVVLELNELKENDDDNKKRKDKKMRIELEQCVAAVVDFQEKLVPVIHEKESLIERSGILLSGLKVLEVPICMTQQYTKGLGMTVPEITEAVGSEEYLEKIEFSSYDAIAKSIKGKKFVIVCGIEAHICVLQTVIDLKAKGYQPVLVVDCISSRKKSDKKIALRRAEAEGAILTTSESLLFELLKKAGTDTSKKIQKLIK